jgi:hypothetical protein
MGFLKKIKTFLSDVWLKIKMEYRYRKNLKKMKDKDPFIYD